MEYVHPEVQEISVNVTTFSSLTPQEKRQMIHKRSVDHFKKTDKGDLANTKKQIMNDIRSRVEGRKI
jgi:hypothetical protein